MRPLILGIALIATALTLLPPDAPGVVEPVAARCTYMDPVPVCQPCTPPLDPEDPPANPEDLFVVCPM